MSAVIVGSWSIALFYEECNIPFTIFKMHGGHILKSQIYAILIGHSVNCCNRGYVVLGLSNSIVNEMNMIWFMMSFYDALLTCGGPHNQYTRGQ